MKRSSYHNVLQSWIKQGLLEKHYFETRNIATHYDTKRKMYVGKKTPQKVLVLRFRHKKSFFIREENIEDYLHFIAEHGAGAA